MKQKSFNSPNLESMNILEILFDKIHTSYLSDKQKQMLIKTLESYSEKELKTLVLKSLEKMDIDVLSHLIKLSYEEFVRRAIIRLRQKDYKGIHSVYSGFNDAFSAYYDEDPVKVIRKLSIDGKVILRPAKGGSVIYLPEDAPDVIKRLNSFLEEIKGIENICTEIDSDDMDEILWFLLSGDETVLERLLKKYDESIIENFDTKIAKFLDDNFSQYQQEVKNFLLTERAEKLFEEKRAQREIINGTWDNIIRAYEGD